MVWSRPCTCPLASRTSKADDARGLDSVDVIGRPGLRAERSRSFCKRRSPRQRSLFASEAEFAVRVSGFSGSHDFFDSIPMLDDVPLLDTKQIIDCRRLYADCSLAHDQ